MKRIMIIGASCLAIAGLALGSVVAQNADAKTGSQASTARDLSQQLEQLEENHTPLVAVHYERTLREALPNVKFDSDENDLGPRPAYGGIVAGHVTSVSEPRVFRDELSTDAARSIELEPGSADGSWAILEMTIDVSDDFDPLVEDPENLVIGFVVNSFDLAEGLPETLEGQHVIIGYERPEVFAPDPNLSIVARTGQLFGIISEDGRISMPLLGEEEREFLGELTTLEAVTSAAAEAETVIHVTLDGYETYERVEKAP